MRITIKERLRPFSHTPGTRLLLPGTTQIVQIFPKGEKDVGHKHFLVTQDLERGRILVVGDKGRYEITGEGRPPLERLSLGSHKKQDWDLVTRRLDLAEILPVWFSLGQWTPPVPYTPAPSLLEEGDFLAAFRAGFSDLFVPRNTDLQHHGFDLPPIVGDPLALLTEGAKKIRALFIEEGERLSLLPHLPLKFHAGRMTGLQTKWGELSIEWSKKRLRRALLIPSCSGPLHLTLQRDLKSWRCQGKRMDREVPLVLEEGVPLHLDRFEK